MPKVVNVKGRCVKLGPGQHSHYRAHCKPGETWRHGYKRVVKATKKSLKSIEKNVQTNVAKSRLAQTCSTSDLAEVIDACIGGMIEKVRKHIAMNEHLALEAYPSDSTLLMIAKESKAATRCVLNVVSRCGGANKDQIRLMVDQYIQEQLNVDSMIPPMEKDIIERRAEKLGEIDNFVQRYRSGLRVSDPILSSSKSLSFSDLM